MKEQIEKLDLHSHDIAEDKRQELLHLFPEIRTEGVSWTSSNSSSRWVNPWMSARNELQDEG
jgi:hypothetical protein